MPLPTDNHRGTSLSILKETLGLQGLVGPWTWGAGPERGALGPWVGAYGRVTRRPTLFGALCWPN